MSNAKNKGANASKQHDKAKAGDGARTKEHNSKETFHQESQAQQGAELKKGRTDANDKHGTEHKH